jgi:dihydroxyacetone kinase-like predicted kinase
MNPIIDTIASAINKTMRVNLVLPNNTNIILAALQASELTEKGRRADFRPNASAGIAASMAYSKDASASKKTKPP